MIIGCSNTGRKGKIGFRDMPPHLEPAACFRHADNIPPACAGLSCLPAFTCPSCPAVLLHCRLVSLAAG